MKGMSLLPGLGPGPYGHIGNILHPCVAMQVFQLSTMNGQSDSLKSFWPEATLSNEYAHVQRFISKSLNVFEFLLR